MTKQSTLLGKPIVFVDDMPNFGEIILCDFTRYIRKITIIRCCDSPNITSNQDNTGYVCPNCGKTQRILKPIRENLTNGQEKTDCKDTKS